jgi:hypothetical protein
MKVLISNDGTHAHYFQRLSWANAFNAAGIETAIWDCKNIPAFDAFDKFEPDIFLGQAYNLDAATIKCIYERPHLKVGLRAGDWGDQEEEVDKSRFNILYCSQQEKELLKKLKEETGKPDFVHIHYNHEDIKRTHNHFESIGITPKSLMMCADIFTYRNSTFDPTLECDIGFIGGYWPYKGQVLDKYLLPLLHPLGEYSVKIFGNQPWGVNQYCGLISDDDAKNLFASAKICPNLSEPHAQEFGIDLNERIFKVLYAGGFCITDNVEAYKMFGDGVVIAESPEDFKEKIDFYLQNTEDRNEIAEKGNKFVADNHTSIHRIAEILDYFDLKQLSKQVIESYKEFTDGER